MNAVDLMGLSCKKFIILVGVDQKWDNSLQLWAQYQYNKLIEEWIKKENILTFTGVTTVDDINAILDPLKRNLWDIYFYTHANENELWIWWQIDKETISWINSINPIHYSTSTMTIVWCNSWKWTDSIAQHMSNELWIKVKAPDWYVSINNNFIFTPTSLFMENWEDSLFNIPNIFNSIKELKVSSWKYFTPNN